MDVFARNAAKGPRAVKNWILPTTPNSLKQLGRPNNPIKSTATAAGALDTQASKHRVCLLIGRPPPNGLCPFLLRWSNCEVSLFESTPMGLFSENSPVLLQRVRDRRVSPIFRHTHLRPARLTARGFRPVRLFVILTWRSVTWCPSKREPFAMPWTL